VFIFPVAAVDDGHAKVPEQHVTLSPDGSPFHFRKETLNEKGMEVNRFELLSVKVNDKDSSKNLDSSNSGNVNENVPASIEFTLDVCILRDSIEYSNLFVPDDVIRVRQAMYQIHDKSYDSFLTWKQIASLWRAQLMHPVVQQSTLTNFWDQKLSNLTNIEHIIGPFSFIQDTYRLTVFVPYNLKDDSRIIIHMRAKTRGWIGFGIAPLKGFGMANAAMVVGQHSINTMGSGSEVGAANMQLSRWYSPRAKQLPIFLDNAEEALISARYNSLESMTHFTFKFSINCTREYPIPISLSPDKNRFIIAFSSDDELLLKYHGPVNRESNSMSFLTPAAEPLSQDWKTYSIIIHATLMIFAWCVCASGGIYTARFLRNRFPKHWIKIHIFCQVGTILGTIFGFVAALAPKNFLLNVEDPHSLIGVMVFLSIFPQTVLGVITDKMREPNRGSVPVLPDKLHWIFGRTMWIMALANILLGLSLVTWHWTIKLSIWLWLALLVSIFVFSKRVSHSEEHNKHVYRQLKRTKREGAVRGQNIDFSTIDLEFHEI